ncbi:MAG: aspartate aminotransferase family protein, partial [Bdellovibrionales bacterium]|nr:aspartate aminotransferase family protein [Bdellovibrionales bacterium]
SKISSVLKQLNEQFKSETPKYTPRYIGHMVSELSMPAILGHFATLLHNPNNTSKEVSRVGATIENEAIAMLAEMVGYDPLTCSGHFTSGGTLANFEAVWRARYRYDHWMSLGLFLAEECQQNMDIYSVAHMGWSKYNQYIKEFDVDEEKLKKYSAVLNNPYRMYRLVSKYLQTDYLGPIVMVPGNKHFSWQKAVNIFGLGEESFWTIPLNQFGKIDVSAFKNLVEKARVAHRPILVVVSVAGTTETGEIDSVNEVQNYLEQLKSQNGLDVWHHVDAAYGGFMCSLLGKSFKFNAYTHLVKALEAISKVNSVTLDPHKLGYVPYSCGAFLAKNSENYSVSSFLAPYIDRKDLGDGKWSSTIEGSRSAAGASATWLTGKSVGYTSDVFASVIHSTFEACQNFKNQVCEELNWVYALEPADTNIFCFSVAEEGDSLSLSNKKTLEVFKKFTENPNFAVSKTGLSVESYNAQIRFHVNKFNGEIDDNHMVLIRCVFMNPFWGEEKVQEKLTKEFIETLKKDYLKQNVLDNSLTNNRSLHLT